ncbi:hypothetical protein PSA7680_02451 [Pseudoruegeria aquimaris]|uniref:Phage gp36-like protein n=1 Tax=Pseudoruegeria aquimaris TaxID=393663 RepID=A0A1Y5SST3_9RHOB|nr:phage protein Gp36 family protein [Pseudoruegeria aquimaris]SLN47707.1 hypothetical protein PSA7680_02451 [Pseudoruegeria aquimaris]
MAYATSQDMIDRFSEQQLVEVTDPEILTIKVAALDRALEDASDEIDGYLEGRYRLPLQSPPRSLRILACNIAMYRLLSLRQIDVMEDQRQRYEDAIKYLRAVANGDINLGLNQAGQTVDPAGGPTLVAGPERTFSRDRLKGF